MKYLRENLLHIILMVILIITLSYFISYYKKTNKTIYKELNITSYAVNFENLYFKFNIHLNQKCDTISLRMVGSTPDSIPYLLKYNKNDSVSEYYDNKNNLHHYTNPLNATDTFKAYFYTSTSYRNLDLKLQYPITIVKKEYKHELKTIYKSSSETTIMDSVYLDVQKIDTVIEPYGNKQYIPLCTLDTCSLFTGVYENSYYEVTKLFSVKNERRAFDQRITGRIFFPEKGDNYTYLKFYFSSGFDSDYLVESNNIEINIESDYNLESFNFFPQPDERSLYLLKFNSKDKLKQIAKEGIVITGGNRWAKENLSYNNFIVSVTIGALVSFIISLLINIFDRIRSEWKKSDEKKIKNSFTEENIPKLIEKDLTNEQKDIQQEEMLNKTIEKKTHEAINEKQEKVNTKKTENLKKKKRGNKS